MFVLLVEEKFKHAMLIKMYCYLGDRNVPNKYEF